MQNRQRDIYTAYLVFLFLLVCALPLVSMAQQGTVIENDGEQIIIYPAGSEPEPEPSPMRREGAMVFFGNVQVDTIDRSVTTTGWVNQTEGLVEVLACGLQGKTHESIFVLPVNPMDLQLALLLLGLKGGRTMVLASDPPEGAPVDIFVEWMDEKGPHRARAEEFVLDIRTNEKLPETPWTFTGSVTEDGRFKAFFEESLIVTFWDPYAIINLPLEAGSNDDWLFANPEIVPPYGTPITMIVKPASRTKPPVE